MRAEQSKNDRLETLIERYLSMVELNLSNIDKTAQEKEYESSLENLIKKAAGNLTEKWVSGQKTLRTEIVYRALSEYPDSTLDVSLTLDAMINLLDDIYDEVLSREEMSLYIVELIRTIANMNRLEDYERVAMEQYFNKIMVIAFSEQHYRTRIRDSVTYGERLSNVIKCYEVKSTDMDAFIELPLRAKGLSDDVISKYTQLGRVHRAVSIIVKDLNDLEHDTEMGVETPVVLLYGEGNGLTKGILDDCMKHFENEADIIWKKIPEKHRDVGEELFLLTKEVVEGYREKYWM